MTAVKSVVPFANLPLADRETAWDAGAAVGRIREACGGADSMDWEKYRKGFCWYDSANAEQFGSYKLPIADVIEGTLTAIPRGIFAAAAAVQGARGGVEIPEADVPGVKAHLAKYYAKLEMTPPWENSSKAADFATVLAARQAQEALSESRWDIMRALEDSIESCISDEAMTSDAKLALIGQSLDQYKVAMLGWCGRALAMIASQGGEGVMEMMARPGSAEWFHQALMYDLGQTKEGRRNSGADLGRIQGAHDLMVELGAKCSGTGPDDEGKAGPVPAADRSHSPAKAGPGDAPPTAPMDAAGPGSAPPTSRGIDVARLNLELAEIELAMMEV